MRESRTYGSVRAKAEWLSYSTIIAASNRTTTGGGAHGHEPPRQFPQREVGPEHAFPHRIAGREFLQQLSQIGLQGRPGVRQRWASAPFIRTRLAAGSSGSSKS